MWGNEWVQLDKSEHPFFRIVAMASDVDSDSVKQFVALAHFVHLQENQIPAGEDRVTSTEGDQPGSLHFAHDRTKEAATCWSRVTCDGKQVAHKPSDSQSRRLTVIQMAPADPNLQAFKWHRFWPAVFKPLALFKRCRFACTCVDVALRLFGRPPNGFGPGYLDSRLGAS